MSQGVPAVTTAEVGIASGFLGAGIGYVLAPKRYGFEQILIQKDDEFNKSISLNKVLQQGTEEQKEARKTLLKARLELKQAIEKNVFEAELGELMHDSKVANAYKSVKTFIPRARAQSALILGLFSAALAIVIKKFSNN